MGVTYDLVNHTKREWVGAGLPFAKAKEWLGNPAAGALCVWYMLSNSGDDIQLISDETQNDYSSYQDVTDDVIEALLGDGIVADYGKSFVDEAEPEEVYVRDIRFRLSYLWPHGGSETGVDL